MNILAEIKKRFQSVLVPLIGEESGDVLDMIRPAQNPQFGDYQANCAMPLTKRLGRASHEIAQEIVDHLEIDDLFETPEIAGPGFINLKLRTDWLESQIQAAGTSERMAVQLAETPKTYVVDYSSPNVAKPMHVGHIRTTVIGDSLCRILRFLGHTVISDNHLGDWGTQFGMIIYGYRNFVDKGAYDRDPVNELGRIYRQVRQVMDYHDLKSKLPKLQDQFATSQQELEEAKEQPKPNDKGADKKAKKAIKRLQDQLNATRESIASAERKIAAIEADKELLEVTKQHPDIGKAALQETAKLHSGDEDNLKLWHEFLPKCREDIQRIYDRLDVTFDHELGESFYHDQLADIVKDFEERDLARESDGAKCIFLDSYETPMIIQKKDGAFLYATTDLATIAYRMKNWKPDAVLYVVDFRQSEHFEKLFEVAKIWGYGDVEFRHVKFGTVLGPDGKPYKTREGDTVGLEGLLDQAVAKAANVVNDNDDKKPQGPELSEEERQSIAKTIGIAAIKYADLSHNRASDYTYNEEKMVALKGNTATYLQYSYARSRAIIAKAEMEIDLLWSNHRIAIGHEKERALALGLLRFSEAIDNVLIDYEPNQLTAYLFELAGMFSSFYDACPVLNAETDQERNSRLLLCDMVGRTMQIGLSLLGIKTVERM